MAEEQEQNGTEEPTERRRKQAREEGQVVQSPDFAAASSMLAGALLLLWCGPWVSAGFRRGIQIWLAKSFDGVWDPMHTHLTARWMSTELVMMCGVPLGILAAIALMTAFSQVGFVPTFKPLAVDFEKLSPSRNWQRLVSIDNGVRGLLSFFKVSLIVAFTLIFFYIRSDEYRIAATSSVLQVTSNTWTVGLRIWIWLSGLLLFMATLDYLVRRFRHEKKLKMSRDEIKREHKEENGDPLIKMAARRRLREAMKQRSVADVHKATVVLTNPTHLAVAIQYEIGKMSAPRVVAKGAGIYAKNIVRIAKENKIQVIQRKPLARAIYKNIKVGQDIPPEFFRAVAEILAQIYRMKRSA